MCSYYKVYVVFWFVYMVIYLENCQAWGTWSRVGRRLFSETSPTDGQKEMLQGSMAHGKWMNNKLFIMDS